ncbi:bacillithiol biosynthesis cysteine-adding enzyme BshC [Metabacillus sp. Hm71]|uniref:bacillithiol biosynthesis cysteine-adding enzyme BshC n=1 Tax=Metabacillus sp. Hm71 TaxID=3450743 RepID=UPI003F41F51D
MEIFELSLRSSNQFMNDFNEQKLKQDKFFDYNIHTNEVFQHRAADLKNRSFQREELSAYLKRYAKRFSGNLEKTLENIERLKHPESVVVIGGQQAGLLTGPLYTIHKIISILVLAKNEEKKLGIPVIPVFWIAGEDHDFAEINHVFAAKNHLPKKMAIKDSPLKKQPVSDLPLNKQKTVEWIEQVFEAFGETDHSNHLLEQLISMIQNSATYVEFFEHAIMELFKHEGLVLVNSGDPGLRQLEKACFLSIVDQNRSLYDAVKIQQEEMHAHHYRSIIEMPENSANLFYHHEGERFLIERKNDEEFFVSEIGLSLSKAELIDLINTYPQKLSNNVVTRPIMQEHLFPTLAFIAGPGEVTYWAELKRVFSIMEIKMPPVLPRLTITLLERSIERNMTEANISLEDVLQNGVGKLIDDFLQSVSPVDMTPLVEEAKQKISGIHEGLIESALKIDKSLEPLLKKNGLFIQEQLDFLHRTVEKRKQQQHEVQISKFKAMELSLLPNLQPQERIWNIYYYLNKFGPEFVGELLNLSYSFNGKHKIVKI